MGACNNDRLSIQSCKWVVADDTFYTTSMMYYNDSLSEHKLIECISIHVETDTSMLRCIKYYTDSAHRYENCNYWNQLFFEVR